MKYKKRLYSKIYTPRTGSWVTRVKTKKTFVSGWVNKQGLESVLQMRICFCNTVIMLIGLCSQYLISSLLHVFLLSHVYLSTFWMFVTLTLHLNMLRVNVEWQHPFFFFILFESIVMNAKFSNQKTGRHILGPSYSHLITSTLHENRSNWHNSQVSALASELLSSCGGLLLYI